MAWLHRHVVVAFGLVAFGVATVPKMVDLEEPQYQGLLAVGTQVTGRVVWTPSTSTHWPHIQASSHHLQPQNTTMTRFTPDVAGDVSPVPVSACPSPVDKVGRASGWVGGWWVGEWVCLDALST
jgi:hypothetical protein